MYMKATEAEDPPYPLVLKIQRAFESGELESISSLKDSLDQTPASGGTEPSWPDQWWKEFSPLTSFPTFEVNLHRLIFFFELLIVAKYSEHVRRKNALADRLGRFQSGFKNAYEQLVTRSMLVDSQMAEVTNLRAQLPGMISNMYAPRASDPARAQTP